MGLFLPGWFYKPDEEKQLGCSGRWREHSISKKNPPFQPVHIIDRAYLPRR